MHPARDHKRRSATYFFGGKEAHRLLNSCYIFITTSRAGIKKARGFVPDKKDCDTVGW